MTQALLDYTVKPCEDNHNEIIAIATMISIKASVGDMNVDTMLADMDSVIALHNQFKTNKN